MNTSALLKLSPETLATITAGTSPAGITALSNDPESRGYILIIVNTIFAFIMTICFTIRVYTRVAIQRKVTWSDFLLLAGYLGVVTMYIARTLMVTPGGTAGFHLWDISLLNLLSERSLLPFYITTIVNNPTFGLAKLSIFILYLELFVGLRWMRICVYIGATISSIFYLAISIWFFYIATPFGSASWRSQFLSPHLEMNKRLGVPTSVVGLGIDIYLFILPLIAVSNLRIPTRKKVLVMVGFSVGLLACVGSVLSLVYRLISLRVYDVTWHALDVLIVTLIELFCGIIIACFSSLVLFFRTYQKQFKKLGMAIASLFCCTRCRKSNAVIKDSQNTSDLSEQTTADDANLYPHLDFLTTTGDIERGELEKRMENRIGLHVIAV